jgi:hypothetical protein
VPAGALDESPAHTQLNPELLPPRGDQLRRRPPQLLRSLSNRLPLVGRFDLADPNEPMRGLVDGRGSGAGCGGPGGVVGRFGIAAVSVGRGRTLPRIAGCKLPSSRLFNRKRLPADLRIVPRRVPQRG